MRGTMGGTRSVRIMLKLSSKPEPRGSGCGLIRILRRHGNGGGRGGVRLDDSQRVKT